jgi:4-amino-4-deoxy-L-arabinose transferase-like glycosyltransferase
MKKSPILWSVLLGVLGILFIEHIFAFKSIPLTFKPNWLTIIPAMAMCAACVGVLIHKELAVAESRTRKAKAELAMACTASAAR